MEQLAMIVRLERLAQFVERGLITEPKGKRRDNLVKSLAQLDQRIANFKEETGYE